jgi:co-chaperonin GroES (HSP10)
VNPGAKPLGGRILVQLRRTKKKTTGAGIILVEETKETEKWNNMVAKVIEIGPLAFKNRDTMQAWPEGSWCVVGDYIRVPKWGGDRWEVKVEGEDDFEDPALFMILNDHEVIAKVIGDPLAMKAFL